LLPEAVQGRGFAQSLVQTRQITKTEVISQNQDDIWLCPWVGWLSLDKGGTQ